MLRALRRILWILFTSPLRTVHPSQSPSKTSNKCQQPPKKRSNRTKCLVFLLSPLKATADVIWLFNQPINNHFACLPFWCSSDGLTPNYVMVVCVRPPPVSRCDIRKLVIVLCLFHCWIFLLWCFLINSSWIKIHCNGICVVFIHFLR